MKKISFPTFVLALLITAFIPAISHSDANAQYVSLAGKSVKTDVFEGSQQDKLYTNEFPLGDVKLLDGPFKHAQELNIQTLLEYDVDRLLAPYRKEAGLPAKAVSYTNWAGLDGHIGGHYLSALSIHYAATGNETCKQLMDYMVNELRACQEANALKYPGWGVGYAGGVPNSDAVWSTFKSGNFSNFNAAWVPWYNLHKTFAGLRDAWLYGNNQDAKEVFLLFCDWAIDITSGLTDAQMENMLNTEHGGMNEVLADAYQISGNEKYINAAKRFSHKFILNSMASRVDNLDNLHANTQVPKAVGFQRIAELTRDNSYAEAARFFWQTVTQNRSLAFGGNSRREHFPAASACIDYINDVEGPESCNTHNMLKLTEDLFRVDPNAKYADYYERAVLNHILSTQHPEHGGYVYFTPARPQHYRVYSAPNKAMWCCVGTGMENHGKYGEFIYTRMNDALYLNLFIASELNWKDKGVILRQETAFPEEEQTKLYITSTGPVDFTLMVRSPKWVKPGELKIIVNTDTLDVESVPQTYIPVQRTWNNGDSVRIDLPMHNSVEHLPNVEDYVAVMHGPVLLGARTGTENLTGLIADDSRWGHIASGSQIPLNQAPTLVFNTDSVISSNLLPVEGQPLHFTAKVLYPGAKDSTLELEPFYKIHDARYIMYWLTLSEEKYQHTLDSIAKSEQVKLQLEARTLDKVAPGEQQPEADHNMQAVNSVKGKFQNEFWRYAKEGGYFSYTLHTDGKQDLSLMVRYWGNETGNKTFDILIDDEKLVTENIAGKWNTNDFVNMEYPIPNSMTAGKEEITVKFQPVDAGNIAGRIFYIRLLAPLNTTGMNYLPEPRVHWKACIQNQNIIVTGIDDDAVAYLYNVDGRLLAMQASSGNQAVIPVNEKGVKLLLVKSKNEVQAKKLFVY